MKKTKTLLFAIVSISGIGALVAACHGPMKESPEERLDSMSKRIAWTLDFDSSQKAKLNALKEEIAVKLSDMRKDRAKNHEQMVQFVKSDRIEKRDLESYIDKRINEFMKNKSFFIDKIIEFHSILNNDQKKKIVDFMEERYKETNE